MGRNGIEAHTEHLILIVSIGAIGNAPTKVVGGYWFESSIGRYVFRLGSTENISAQLGEH